MLNIKIIIINVNSIVLVYTMLSLAWPHNYSYLTLCILKDRQCVNMSYSNTNVNICTLRAVEFHRSRIGTWGQFGVSKTKIYNHEFHKLNTVGLDWVGSKRFKIL